MTLNSKNQIATNKSLEQFDYEAAFEWVHQNSNIDERPDMRNNETLDNQTSSEFTIEDGKQYIKPVVVIYE